MRFSFAPSLMMLFGGAAACVHAGESVTITYDPGYPSPGVSSDATRFVISREAGMNAQQVRAVDAYFDAVRKILGEAPLPSSCCVTPVDSPTIEIDISLDTKVYQLTFANGGAAGLELPVNPTFEQRRAASVMERILKVSEERIASNESEAALMHELVRIAGSNADSCGMVRFGDDFKRGWACATARTSSGQPFWFALQARRVDSDVWSAIAQDRTGNRYVILYTSNKYGQAEFVPEFDSRKCQKPFSFNPESVFPFGCGEVRPP